MANGLQAVMIRSFVRSKSPQEQDQMFRDLVASMDQSQIIRAKDILIAELKRRAG